MKGSNLLGVRPKARLALRPAIAGSALLAAPISVQRPKNRKSKPFWGALTLPHPGAIVTRPTVRKRDVLRSTIRLD